MILITGAAGKTGQAIIQQLRAHNLPIRAMVRNPKQVESLHMRCGADSQPDYQWGCYISRPIC